MKLCLPGALTGSSATVTPHPASVWAKGADALPVNGPPRGLTDAVVRAVEISLDAHELVKVKFNGLKDEKQEIARAIEARTESTLVTVLGNIATFYRPNPDEEKREIVLP